MKKQILKSAFVATLFGTGTLIPTTSFAAAPDCSAVTGQALLVTCIDANLDITLGDNITLNNSLVIRGGHNIAIDLAGKNLTLEKDSEIFQIREGKLELTGSGTVKQISQNTARPVIRIYGSTNSEETNYSSLIVDKDITLQNNQIGGTAITIDGNNSDAYYGINVDFRGTANSEYGIRVADDIDISDNAPTIKVADNATITAAHHAILAEGYANWNIGSAKLDGGSGLGIKQGSFIIDGATITASGENNPTPEPLADSMNDSGAAIQIETIADKTDQSDLYIKNGTFISKNGYGFVEYAGDEYPNNATLRTFTIREGLLQGTNNFENSVGTSSTGAFFWWHGDGRMLEDGSYILESFDDYDSHKVTVARFANSVVGLEEIYNDYDYVERILPVFTPFDSLDDSEAAALATSEYKDAKIASVTDIALRRFDKDDGPVILIPGTSKPFSFVMDTGVDYPLTFNIDMPATATIPTGYVRHYYVLSFHLTDMREGTYKIEKLPVKLSEDGTTYSFSAHEFSTFALAYEDEQIIPAAPNTGYYTKY